MNIRRGSALKESAKAVVTETIFTKSFFGKDKLLLLEGPDDVEVINSYYLYKGKEVKKTFRLLKANDEEIDGSSKVAGKRNAIKLFERLEQEKRNVICLLDRDYDFFLREKHSNPRVMYYDYYELENYLFEDTLLRIIIKNACNYSQLEVYEEILHCLHKIEEYCKPFIQLCILREINYRSPVLSEVQLEKVLKILREKPSSMMRMQHLGIENALERISGYIDQQLSQVGLDTTSVEKIIVGYDNELSSILSSTEPLYLFKYAIKGKIISNSLSEFIKYILEENPHLKKEKPKGDLSNITGRLKVEWIPGISQEFSYLLQKIEQEFSG
ncbi:DUF4435 domain-containing protein [Paenibacillus sp. PAMC21692]|uniref:DUF4435 domain-containing protein n=1 Tax=Paenibacillus sp. PAMC21692 TaxID=2762320 RepID=UPI00164ED4D6|nr:DUF4435 domain-containing protein [Paenibacillus sp. PAMC21692]QNK57323.1 DUF4435 domain-containing protein [Paenibacillus sp. PAMC21692]